MGVWAQMEAVSMPVTATRVPSATRGSARRPSTGRVAAAATAPGATTALSARASSVMGGGRVGRPLHRVAATSATARDQVPALPPPHGLRISHIYRTRDVGTNTQKHANQAIAPSPP